jgi:hypothetical protein
MKTVETRAHDAHKAKNIPTAEYQLVQKLVRVGYPLASAFEDTDDFSAGNPRPTTPPAEALLNLGLCQQPITVRSLTPTRAAAA